MNSLDRFLKSKTRQQSQIQKPLKHFTSFLDVSLPAHGAEVAQPGRALDPVTFVTEGEAEDRVVAGSNPALGTTTSFCISPRHGYERSVDQHATWINATNFLCSCSILPITSSVGRITALYFFNTWRALGVIGKEAS